MYSYSKVWQLQNDNISHSRAWKTHCRMGVYEDPIHWDPMVGFHPAYILRHHKGYTPGTRHSSISAIATCPDRSHTARGSLTGPSFATLMFVTTLGFALEGAG